MEISRDEPGRTLELSQSSDPMSWRAALLMLGLIPLWIFPVLMLSAALSHAQAPGGPAWCLIAFAVTWYAFVGLVTFGVIWASRRTVRLYISRASDEWVSEESAIVPFYARRTSIPLHEIERIEVRTSPRHGLQEGSSIWLLIQVDRAAHESFDLRGPIFVTGVDRRAEFLEFALRLADVVGLQGYRVASDRPTEYRIELFRTRGKGMEGVPTQVAEADYELDTRRGDPLPADLPAFDPHSLPGPYHVDRWEPGKVIAVHRPRAREGRRTPLLGCGCLVGIGLVLTLAVAYDMGAGRVVLGVLCLPWAAVYAFSAWHISQGAPPVHVVIDWEGRVVRLVRDGRKSEVPFAEIERIDVKVGRHSCAKERGEDHYTSRRVEVVLLRVNQVPPPPIEEVLIEVRGPLRDPERPRRPAAAFGVELARALGVPVRYVEAREQWS